MTIQSFWKWLGRVFWVAFLLVILGFGLVFAFAFGGFFAFSMVMVLILGAFWIGMATWADWAEEDL